MPSKEQTIHEYNLKTVSRLILLITIFLSIDVIICAFQSNWGYMYSSLFLVILSFIAWRFLKNGQLYRGINIIGISYYLISLYHTTILGNVVTSYFILLVAPLVLALILQNRIHKYLYLISSVVLFFICNSISEQLLSDTYFFFLGLFPCFFTMLFFSQLLTKTLEEKNSLILKLENQNREQILYSQMMSHDLKAPLNNISGFSKLLLKDENLSPDQKTTILNHMFDSSVKMSSLLDALLEMSQLNAEEFRYQEFSLDEIIKEIELLLSFEIKSKKVELLYTTEGTIKANRESIKGVIQNLISNALKYQPIDEPTHKPKIHINQFNSDGWVIITIADNGIGIDEKFHSILFKPFKRFHSTQKYNGSGLGLSICDKIIDKHGGTIQLLSSKINEGSMFEIKLPR